MALTAGLDAAATRHDVNLHAPGRSAAEERAGDADGRGDEGFWGDDGLTFGDVLDLINPLQHLPIVSSVYRAATDDEISSGARLLGGLLFGGVFGLVGAIVNAIVEDTTGKDIGAHVLAVFDGDEAPEPESVALAPPATPAGPLPWAAAVPAEPAPVGRIGAVGAAKLPERLAQLPHSRSDYPTAAARFSGPEAVGQVLDTLREELDKHERMRAANALYRSGRHDPAFEKRSLDTVA